MTYKVMEFQEDKVVDVRLTDRIDGFNQETEGKQWRQYARGVTYIGFVRGEAEFLIVGYEREEN